MSRWNLDNDSAQLRGAIDDLQIAWGIASESWQDGVSHKFCETHLEPIGPVLKQALEAASRMQQLLNQMEQECGE